MTLTDKDRALIESVLKDDADAAISQDLFTLDEVIALLSASRQARTQGPGEGLYPPLMVNPMKCRDSGQVDARLTEAYVRQQAFVPDQSALVWRADLGRWKSELLRLRALVDLLREQAAAPPASQIKEG